MKEEVLVEKIDNLEERVDKVEERLEKTEWKIGDNSISIATLITRMDNSIKSMDGLTSTLKWGIGGLATIVLGLLAIYFK